MKTEERLSRSLKAGDLVRIAASAEEEPGWRELDRVRNDGVRLEIDDDPLVWAIWPFREYEFVETDVHLKPFSVLICLGPRNPFNQSSVPFLINGRVFWIIDDEVDFWFKRHED